jgi:hypothetical protein
MKTNIFSFFLAGNVLPDEFRQNMCWICNTYIAYILCFVVVVKGYSACDITTEYDEDLSLNFPVRFNTYV